jgi:hypothetical protein
MYVRSADEAYDQVMYLAAKAKKRKKTEKDREQDRKLIGGKIKKFVDHHPVRQRYNTMARYLAFAKGAQHEDVAMSPEKARAMEMMGETLETQNELVIALKMAVNRLKKTHPLPVGTSVSSDLEDMEAADYVTSVSKFITMNQRWGLRKQLYPLLFNAFVGAVSYLHIFFDEDLKFPGTYFDGKKIVRKYGVLRGDFRTEVLDSYQAFRDPTATNYYDMRYVVVLDDISELEANRKYKRGDRCEGDGGLEDQLKKKFQYLWQHCPVEEKPEKRCLRMIFYSRPGPGAPKGRRIVVINGEAKEIGVNPLWSAGTDYCMPVVPFFWDKDGTSFEGVSPMRDMIGAQISINRILYLLIKNAKTTAQPRVLIPGGDKISHAKGDGAEPWMYNYEPVSGSPGPFSMSGQSVPEYVLSLKGALETYIMRRAGIQDVNLGITPRERVPAAALRQLSEESMTMPSNNLEDLGESMLQATRVILEMMRLYYKADRQLTWTGYNRKPEWIAWNEQALTEKDTGFALDMSDSTLRDPAAQADMALALNRDGIFTQLESSNIQEREAAAEVLKAVKYGRFEDIYLSGQIQKSHAKRALDKIIEKPVDKSEQSDYYIDMEDPVIHYRYFRDYIMSEPFEQLDKLQQRAIVERGRKYYAKMTESQQPPPPGGGGGGEGLIQPGEQMPPTPEGI